jgi:hypothetical protein
MVLQPRFWLTSIVGGKNTGTVTVAELLHTLLLLVAVTEYVVSEKGA